MLVSAALTISLQEQVVVVVVESTVYTNNFVASTKPLLAIASLTLASYLAKRTLSHTHTIED